VRGCRSFVAITQHLHSEDALHRQSSSKCLLLRRQYTRTACCSCVVLTAFLVPADHYHAIIQEMKLSDDGASYSMVDNCTVDFELTHANKGFEGIQYHEQDGGATVASVMI
jgi:hypothetical protein